MDIRALADRVRNIPLESVLRLSGAEHDRDDRRKWHTAKGVISVTGPKFMNWNCGSGGGGAIDLVKHLHNLRFREAVQWLNDHFRACVPRAYDPQRNSEQPSPKPALAIPDPDPAKFSRVRQYLLCERALPEAFVEPLVNAGTLYGDCHANAVFLLLGKGQRVVGAELRGTGPIRFCGLARGSQKDRGFFYAPAGPVDPASPIILVESAIDAISCAALHLGHVCVSTAGARPDPGWLRAVLDRGYQVYCGFDADTAGDAHAAGIMRLYPSIRRLRPSLKDWNDVLRAAS